MLNDLILPFRPSRWLRGITAGCCLLAASTAMADALDNVLKAGVLRVAVVLDYPPFGSVDANLKPQGYDIEFATLMAQALA